VTAAPSPEEGQKTENREQKIELRRQRERFGRESGETVRSEQAHGAALWKPGAEDAESGRSPRNGSVAPPSRAESPRCVGSWGSRGMWEVASE